MDHQTQAAIGALRRAAEHAISYASGVANRSVFPDSSSLDALNLLDTELPITGSDPLKVIDLLHELASPATVATTGGRYFGLVVGGSTPASMGAGVLTSAWDQVALMESSSPAAVRLENVAAKWILELLNLPEDARVGFVTGTSVGNLVGLAAARNELYARMGIDLQEAGLAGLPPLQVAVSEQAHITVLKALSMLGFGRNQLIRIPCDMQGRMDSQRFPKLPPGILLCMQAGNVNSGASDPFLEIIPRARDLEAWVHVDGAFGLWAQCSERTRDQTAGVEDADSWAVDAHKWLNTPYDCGLSICRHSAAVGRVMATQAAYITGAGSNPPKDTVPEFSRRARGVEVWAAIQEMGSEGVSGLIERCCDHAQTIAVGLEKIGYKILNEVVLNQVVATIGKPEHIDQITSLVQQEGICWFGVTDWQGNHAIRLSVSNWRTSANDVEMTLAAIERATNFVLG